MPRARIEGLEHVERAVAEGRPVVVATLHVGSLLCLCQVLGHHGHDRFYVSGGRPPGEPLSHGYLGRWSAAMNRFVEEAGGRWIYRGGSYPVLRALLERGAVCLLAQDIRGELTVPVLGRRTSLTRGPVSLARETGALYLPAFGTRRGSRQTVHLLEPIDTSLDDTSFGERLGTAIDGALRPRLAEAHEHIAKVLRRAEASLAERVLDRPPQQDGCRQRRLVPARQLDDLGALALGEGRRRAGRAEDPVSRAEKRQLRGGPRRTRRRRSAAEERQRRAQRLGVAGEHGLREALEPRLVELGRERVPGERLQQRVLVADEIRLQSRLLDGDAAPLRLGRRPGEQRPELERGVEEHDGGDGFRQEPPEIGHDDAAEREADERGRRSAPRAPRRGRARSPRARRAAPRGERPWPRRSGRTT